MEVVFAAFIGAISTVILALIGVYGARKAGLGTTQDRLISNLKDLVDSQEVSIGTMRAEMAEQSKKITLLETNVSELKDLTIEQARLIKQLLSKKRIIIQNNDSD